MADLEREDEGEEQAARLCDFVQARSAEILDRWESRARAVVPTARELSGPALRDHRELLHLHEGDGRADLDPDRVAQVAHNLVTNALKYSPPDTIVTVRTRGEEDHVSLEVHNWGKPIAADALPHVFEPLYRATASTSSSDRSVGLGLYIVERIARAHGGRIEVTSTPEQGTIFTVLLPRT